MTGNEISAARYYETRVLRLLDQIEEGKRDIALWDVVLFRSLKEFLSRVAENRERDRALIDRLSDLDELDLTAEGRRLIDEEPRETEPE